MGFHIQSYIAMMGRGINPKTWKKLWTNYKNKQIIHVYNDAAEFTNNQIAQVVRVYQYRYWWWANPFGMGLIFYLGYKAWYMIYMNHKQRKMAQVVASAYGQGGQWLNPVPK
ncbi:conserved Plasmodium protein, unknown function [Plasmodium malariae]|uniref:Uncharacterized protein n=1 Tax=Plasmodium malariae TaxID=5858 RepID=A0A1C3KD33_PLAMA|nr:conserved Plasmodium protein, unknown function [Plasmodium malariae]